MKKEDKAEKCVAWLHAYLGGRTLPCEEVRNAAYTAGFSKRDLQQARAELHIIPGSITTWSLPPEEQG